MITLRKLPVVAAFAGVAACTEAALDPTGPITGAAPELALSIAGGGVGDWFTAHNGTGSSSSFLAIMAPAVNQGDLLIAQITRSKDFTTSDATCAPAGWTSLGKHHFEQKVVQEIFYHVAGDAAAATTHTWHFKTSSAACGTSGSARSGKGATGGIIRYTGVDPWTPISAHATRIATGSTVTAIAPSVSTTGADALVVHLFSAFKNLTFNAVGTTRIYTAGSSNNSSERTAAAYQRIQASPGTTGDFKPKMNTSAEWIGTTLALQPAAVVTVNKVVVPAGDGGKFNLFVNGVEHATDVGDAGTTGAITVPITADVTIAEAAGTSTALADYTTEISCDVDKGSASDITHTFSISAGESVTCTITNTRKAELTITKVLDPTNDPGLFNLQVDGNTELGDAGHNGTVTVKLVPGSYTVGETAGTNTDMDDYTSVINGDCADTGAISLAAGETASCTITNTRILVAPPEIAFQNSTSNMTNPSSGNASTILSISKPAGTVAGDFLLAQITFEKGSDVTVTAPVGWTLVIRTNSSSDIGQAIYRSVFDAGDAAVTGWFWTFSHEAKAAGAIIRYTGVDAANPIVGFTGNSGTTGALTGTGLTAENNSMLVAFFGVKKTTTLTTPVGMASLAFQQNPQDVTLRAADEARNAGVTGDRASTAGTSDKWVAQMVVLRRAP